MQDQSVHVRHLHQPSHTVLSSMIGQSEGAIPPLVGLFGKTLTGLLCCYHCFLLACHVVLAPSLAQLGANKQTIGAQKQGEAHLLPT